MAKMNYFLTEHIHHFQLRYRGNRCDYVRPSLVCWTEGVR